MKKYDFEIITFITLFILTKANGLTVFTRIGFLSLAVLLFMDLFESAKKIFGSKQVQS